MSDDAVEALKMIVAAATELRCCMTLRIKDGRVAGILLDTERLTQAVVTYDAVLCVANARLTGTPVRMH